MKKGEDIFEQDNEGNYYLNGFLTLPPSIAVITRENEEKTVFEGFARNGATFTYKGKTYSNGYFLFEDGELVLEKKELNEEDVKRFVNKSE